MNRLGFRLFLLLALIACTAAAARADLRVKTRTTSAGHSYEGTTLIKGARQRTETDMGIKSVSIMQCDLKRNVQINDAARTYFVMPFDGGSESDAGASATPAGSRPASGPPSSTRRGGVVTYTINMTDTGERKQMFGLTARHVKTTMTFESSPDACTRQKMKMEYDGWYVDLPGFSCDMGGAGYNRSAMPGARPDCVDRVVFKTTGGGKRGYPLQETMTMYGEDGRAQFTTTQEAVELSQATLDASLFDVPAGYRLASSMQELYTGGASMSGASDADEGNDNDDDAASLPSSGTSAGANAGGATSAALGPKREGVVRVGLLMPRAQMVEGRGSNQLAAEAVRAELLTLLRGPSLEAVALDAQTPAQALEEARQKECDYVLVTGLKQKKGGGGMFGGLGRVADAAASHIPYGNTAGEAAAREAARVAVHSTAEIATSVKAKDEVTLDYELLPASGGAAVLKSTAKAKAQADGENVFSPLVGKAAGEVADVAGRR